MGTNRKLAAVGLVMAGLASQANAQAKHTIEVPPPPMLDGAMHQFYDRDLGKWWSCRSGCDNHQRGNISEATAWNITQDSDFCFPGTTIIVPFRVVTEPWFEVDADGNALDPDYIPPNPDIDGMGTEEDVCMREVLEEILVEDMVVEDENFPIIFEAMTVIEELCGITFVQRNPFNTVCFPDDDPMTPGVEPQQPWIRIQQATDECAPFQNLEGNFSTSVGMVPEGVQVIVMEQWSVAVMVHELMHAIGFFHEHQRSDRDTYVTVNEEHILPNDLGQFTKSSDPATNFGDYDFESIMHYGPFAFSFNGEIVIDVNEPFEMMGPEPGYEFTIGSFARPSVGDRDALQHLYGESLLFPVDPCTEADINEDNRVDMTDLLQFIAAWSAEDISADWDGSGVVDNFDLLEFLVSFAQAQGCGPTPPRPVSPERNTYQQPM